MKKTTVFTMAAVCGAFALALPDWKQSLNAAVSYDPIQFTLTGATVTQTLSVSGCPALKTPANKTAPPVHSDITFYGTSDLGGSYAMYRYDMSVVMTGSWSRMPSKGSAIAGVYNLSPNFASTMLMVGELETAALANCQTKFPLMTYVNILEPATLMKSNTVTVKVGKTGATAVSKMQLSGKQINNKTTPPKAGSLSVKMATKGGTFVDEQP